MTNGGRTQKAHRAQLSSRRKTINLDGWRLHNLRDGDDDGGGGDDDDDIT